MATFSASTLTPTAGDIEWSVSTRVRDIDEGVLTFKSSPDFET